MSLDSTRNFQRDFSRESNDESHGVNINRTINHKKYFSSLLFPYIEAKYKATLKPTDKEFIISSVRHVSTEFFRGKTVKQITMELSEIFAQKLRFIGTEKKSIDVKEYQKQLMNIPSEGTDYIFSQSSDQILQQADSVVQQIVEPPKDTIVLKMLGLNTFDDVKKSLKQDVEDLKEKNVYIFLDTKYRDVSQTKYSWNYINSINTSQGTVNSISDMGNMIRIKCLPIRIPKQTGFTTTNNFKRITMLIEEFSAQSILAQENRRFHFIFEVTEDGLFLDLNPYQYNKGVFEFNKKIVSVKTLTITFANPTQLLTFLPDRFQLCSASIASPTVITTPAAHGLLTGDFVIFESFTTTNTTADAARITSFNNLVGYAVTFISAVTFSVVIDTTLMVGTMSTFTTYIQKNRIQIPLEITVL
jgi:hypothetical protein